MTAIRGISAAAGLPFTQIANGMAQDKRLRGLSRAIVVLVLSTHPDHKLTSEWLETQFPEGRRAIRAAMKQLEDLGYLRRTKTAVGHRNWVWEQVITDNPALLTSDRNRSDVTTCGNTASSQVPTSDRFTSDVNRPDKNLIRRAGPVSVRPLRTAPASRRGAFTTSTGKFKTKGAPRRGTQQGTPQDLDAPNGQGLTQARTDPGEAA